MEDAKDGQASQCLEAKGQREGRGEKKKKIYPKKMKRKKKKKKEQKEGEKKRRKKTEKKNLKLGQGLKVSD